MNRGSSTEFHIAGTQTQTARFFCSTVYWNMQEIKLQECGICHCKKICKTCLFAAKLLQPDIAFYIFLVLKSELLKVVFSSQYSSAVTLWVLIMNQGRVVCQDPDNRYRHASSLVEHLTPFQEDISSNPWLDRQLTELHWWSWLYMSCVRHNRIYLSSWVTLATWHNIQIKTLLLYFPLSIHHEQFTEGSSVEKLLLSPN